MAQNSKSAAITAQNAADAAIAVANEAMVLAKTSIADSVAAVTIAGEAADKTKEAVMTINGDLVQGNRFVRLCAQNYTSCRIELARAEETYDRRLDLVRKSLEERDKLLKAAELAQQSYKAVEKKMNAIHLECTDVRTGIMEAQKAVDRAISATNDATNNLARQVDKFNQSLSKINVAITNADKAAVEAKNSAHEVGKIQQEVRDAVEQVKKHDRNLKTCGSPAPTQGQTLDPQILKMIFEKITRLEDALITRQSSICSSNSSDKQQLPVQQADVQSQSAPHTEQDAKKLQHSGQNLQVQSPQQGGVLPKKQPEPEQMHHNTQQPQPLKTEPQSTQMIVAPPSQGSKRKASLALPQARESHHAVKPKQTQQKGDPKLYSYNNPFKY